MSVIWSGITEEGAVVPVQVEESGKVVAQGYPGEKGEKGDPGEEGPPGPPGEYSKGDDVELNNAYFTGVVGIGTASGTSLLTLYSEEKGELRLNPADGSGDGHLFRYGGSAADSNVLRVVTSGDAERLRVDKNGKIGVNTDDPQAMLDVAGDFLAAFGSCGFTSSGELIFSSRGSRYKMFVSNGVCSAEVYTRQMEYQEKLQEFVAGKIETKPLDPDASDYPEVKLNPQEEG